MSCLLHLLDLRSEADACTDDIWLRPNKAAR
jgi:hypothetical protein